MANINNTDEEKIVVTDTTKYVDSYWHYGKFYRFRDYELSRPLAKDIGSALTVQEDIDGTPITAWVKIQTAEDFEKFQNYVEKYFDIQKLTNVVKKYSDLESLLTKDYHVGDKVEVVTDETHNSQNTVYHWDGQLWQYDFEKATNKIDKVPGWGLSENNYDKFEKEKVRYANEFIRVILPGELLKKQEKLIAGAGIDINEETNVITATSGIEFKIVQELPETDISKTTIYLKKSPEVQDNFYDEYIYIENKWEVIGSTKAELSQYATKKDLDTKQDNLISGENIKTINEQNILGKGNLELATDTIIDVSNLPTPGKAIPSSGIINNIYFNTKLSVEETRKILNKIEYNTNNITGLLEYCCFKNQNKVADDITIYKLGDKNYRIIDGSDNIIFSTEASNGINFIGWKLGISDVKEGPLTQIPNTGLQNNKLVNLFSILPFGTSKIKENVIYRLPDNSLNHFYNGEWRRVPTKEDFDTKQETLVSGKNIKTINNIPILGEGDIDVGGVYELETLPLAKGETVPNSGLVQKIYFNTNVDKQEINRLLKSLQYDDFTGLPNNQIYGILASSSNEDYIVVLKDNSNSEYSIDYMHLNNEQIDKSNIVELYNSNTGWSSFNNPLIINSNVLTNSKGINFGLSNETLNTVIAVTKFNQIPEGIKLNSFYRFSNGDLYRFTTNGWSLLDPDENFINVLKLPQNGSTLLNTEYISKVYINKKGSLADLILSLKKLPYDEKNHYRIAYLSDLSRHLAYTLYAEKNIENDLITIKLDVVKTNQSAPTENFTIFASKQVTKINKGTDFEGWNPTLTKDGYILYNNHSISGQAFDWITKYNSDSVSVGTFNNIIHNVVSMIPFEENFEDQINKNAFYRTPDGELYQYINHDWELISGRTVYIPTDLSESIITLTKEEVNILSQRDAKLILMVQKNTSDAYIVLRQNSESSVQTEHQGYNMYVYSGNVVLFDEYLDIYAKISDKDNTCTIISENKNDYPHNVSFGSDQSTNKINMKYNGNQTMLVSDFKTINSNTILGTGNLDIESIINVEVLPSENIKSESFYKLTTNNHLFYRAGNEWIQLDGDIVIVNKPSNTNKVSFNQSETDSLKKKDTMLLIKAPDASHYNVLRYNAMSSKNAIENLLYSNVEYRDTFIYTEIVEINIHSDKTSEGTIISKKLVDTIDLVSTGNTLKATYSGSETSSINFATINNQSIVNSSSNFEIFNKTEITNELNKKQDTIDADHKLNFNLISNLPTTVEGYGITNVYTQEQINNLIGQTVTTELVDSLPTTDIKTNCIYFLKKNNGEYCDEQMYVNGKWEIIGTTKIDLSAKQDKLTITENADGTVDITIPENK